MGSLSRSCFGLSAQEADVGEFLSRAITFGNMHSRCYPPKAAYHLRVTIRAFVCLVLMIAFCTVARSQTATGQFNGHVYDQNGGVLPGATVTLLNLQTNLTRSTQTNGEGLYEFPLVKPGSYRLTVSQTGFDTATSPEFKLEVNQIATQDFKLQVGATSQTVNVTAICRVAPSFQCQPGRCGRKPSG